MSTKTELIVKEQKTVVFYDDELTAVRGDDGQIYVSINQMCRALSLQPRGQQQRIGRQKILNDGQRVCMIHTHSRGKQASGMLRVDLVPLWLSGINTSRIKDDTIRDKVERFQMEAARVLWEAFQSGELTVTADNDIESLAKLDPQAAEALVMAQAIVKLARAQLRQAAIVQDNTQRIEALETAVNDSDRRVTDEQASQISQAVKAIAMELSSASGKNEFGGVYGELYRRQGVTSYKMIKSADFEKCMTWLNEWYQSVANKDLNF